MNDVAEDQVGQMINPPHIGELIRESMDDVAGISLRRRRISAAVAVRFRAY